MSNRLSLASSAALLTAVLSAAVPSPAHAQSVARLSVSPGTSSCVQPVDVTVTLTAPARPGGLIVPLRSTVPTVAPIAANILIGSGATSGVVKIRCVPARQATTVTISAGQGGGAKSATLTVAAALTDGSIRSVTDGNANTIIIGELIARTGGTTGSTTGSFGGTPPPPSTTPPTDGTSNTTAPGTTITTVAPTLSGLTLSATEVAGGLSVIARLTATTGSSGVTVSVFPDRAQAVTLPTTVVFATGESTKSIVINTRPQLQPLTVEIIAADSRTPTLRKIAKFVIRPPRIRSIALTSTIVAAGQPVVGTLTLDGPAPDGFTVRLTSNGAAVPTPAPIAVQAGATVVSFTLPTAATTANAVVTLTAAAQGDALTSGIITTVKITP